MRGSMLSSVVVLAVVLACASNVSAEKESDLVGFSINVPGTNNQVADERGVKDVKVEPVEQPRFQEVNAGASSQQLAMADRQALAQALGESASEVPAGPASPRPARTGRRRRNWPTRQRTGGIRPFLEQIQMKTKNYG